MAVTHLGHQSYTASNMANCARAQLATGQAYDTQICRGAGDDATNPQVPIIIDRTLQM